MNVLSKKIGVNESIARFFFTIIKSLKHFEMKKKLALLNIRDTILIVVGFFTILAGHSTIMADTSEIQKQFPGFWRMKLGNTIVTAIYDGYVEADMTIFKNIPEARIRSLLSQNFINPEKFKIEVNAYVIDNGAEQVLIDAGAGHFMGPTLGQIPANLVAAGYRPDEIDAVLLTHLHVDHGPGLVDAQGNPRYKNATIYSARKGTDYWWSKEAAKNAEGFLEFSFAVVKKISTPYRDAGKWKSFKDGDQLPGGITAHILPGHAPGHAGFELISGNETLLIIGDVIHCSALQFANPEISIVWDANQTEAVKTRIALFKDVAERKIWVAGMHIPFPGIGKLSTMETGGYQWVPLTYSEF
jgi:glyoxylase-like metal-dependent hydrolase (beta-lactamase superfamily II)